MGAHRIVLTASQYHQQMADYYYSRAASLYLISTYKSGWKQRNILDEALTMLGVANDYEKTVLKLIAQGR